MIYSTVIKELDQQVAKTPDEIALVSHYEGIKKTFAEFNGDINRLSKGMVQKLGISKGDIVGVFSYNSYNWILIQYACSRIGAILTPINPSYKVHELAYILEKGNVRCLFLPGHKSVQRELNDHMKILQSQEIVDLTQGATKLEHVVLMDGENDYDLSDTSFKLKNCSLNKWSSLQDNDGILFKSEQEAEAAGVSPENAFILDPDLVGPDDLFAIYYTSGTTGRSKGACISHHTAINNVRFCQIRMRNGRPRNWKLIVCTTLPLFHIFAGVLNAISPAVSSTRVVFSSYKYDIREFVDAIIKNEANSATLTPTILIDMLTYVEQNKLSDQIPLRVVQPGGAALPPELVLRAHKLLPQLEEVRTGYGSTENGAVATFQTFYEPENTRAFTVGPPIDFTEVRVVKASTGTAKENTDDDRCLPLGERGEVQTRGYNTMVNYLNDPTKTSEVITPNRWYRTGDIGTMLPSGSIQITGRLKHMIIKGGENIYPEEVEQIMLKMPAVEKAHVVGVPDERFGEQVCAWIKLKPDYVELKGDYEAVKEQKAQNPKGVHLEDVLRFCRENITYFKIPKYILFVDNFPMTPTKKVQNHLVIEESIKILGLKKKN